MFAEVLDDLLTVAEQSLTDPPSRTFVGTGPGMAWDCEQLTVRTGESTPLYQPTGSACLHGMDVDFHVQVIRCVPTVDDNGQPPSAAQLEEAGHLLNQDARELFDALQDWDPPKPATHVRLVNWFPLGPDGGYAGGEWTVRVRII